MRLVDSHMHLDTFVREGTADLILTRAMEECVEQIIAIGGSEQANRTAITACESHAHVYAVVGYDRDEAMRAPDFPALDALTRHPRVVGVGECGLDYHYHADQAREQQKLFEAMLDQAVRASLPVVVHSREADDDTLRLLSAYAQRWHGPGGSPGVLHCFTGSWPFARSLMDLGFMISFSGIVTFKKSEALRDVARHVPDDFLLVETDAPYLAPVPHRGKTNEPAYVRYVVECLADTRGTDAESLGEITARNARALFGLRG